MKVRELRLGLETFQQTLSNWRVSSEAVSDFRRLSELLAGYDEVTVAEFCKRAEAALAGGSASQSSASAKPALRESIVSAYGTRLRSGELGRDDKLAVLSELKKDKKVRLLELTALANSLTGTDASFKNKGEALSALQNWVHRKFDTERRLGSTSAIF